MRPAPSIPAPRPPAAPQRDEPAANPAKASYLWLWFVAAFVVQGLVWAAWLSIAAKNPVATVPLVQPVLR